MEAGKASCAKCGATIYRTDKQCMSCGADLGTQFASVPQPPLPPPTASFPPPRSASIRSKDPFYAIVISYCGTAWDVFPWFYLAWSFGATYLGFGGAPEPARIVLALVGLILVPVYIFWVICDVLDRQVLFWWIFIAICCEPLGLLAYLLWGRGS